MTGKWRYLNFSRKIAYMIIKWPHGGRNAPPIVLAGLGARCQVDISLSSLMVKQRSDTTTINCISKQNTDHFNQLIPPHQLYYACLGPHILLCMFGNTDPTMRVWEHLFTMYVLVKHTERKWRQRQVEQWKKLGCFVWMPS